MNGTDVAEERRRPALMRRVEQALGPAGVFFRGFIEHPRMVGSIIPSSRTTIERMLAPVDWSECRLFIEYGPGVGTFCGPVLERMRPDAHLLVIDTNALYVDYLRSSFRDSRFSAVLGSAAEVERIVHSLGHEHADYVLSGLPFSTLPDGVGPSIAAATHRVLRPGGAFLTYQFSAVARDLTARHFPQVDTAFVWRNVPPCLLAWGWKEEAVLAEPAALSA